MYSTSGSKVDIDSSYNNGADFYLIKPSCYASIEQQLMELFQNDYFVRNIKAPREEFVFYAAKSHTKKGNYQFSHQVALA